MNQDYIYSQSENCRLCDQLSTSLKVRFFSNPNCSRQFHVDLCDNCFNKTNSFIPSGSSLYHDKSPWWECMDGLEGMFLRNK